jgi:signal transduction histidine kinase
MLLNMLPLANQATHVLSSRSDRHPAVPGVVIRVSDNGPGIPLDEQNDIFERGRRGERTLQIGGSGIGLDISRSMMTRMGGELRLAGSSA